MAGLKTEVELRDAMSRRLARGYAEHIAGVRQDWPHELALGRPTRQQILDDFSAIDALMGVLLGWERDHGVEIAYVAREAGGPKWLPARVTIPSIDVAAALATPRDGERWETALSHARERDAQLARHFPRLDTAVRARVVRKTDGWDELQISLLLAAGEWFACHDAKGMTPREVPLPGIDAKWLDAARNRELVCLLANKEGLGLGGRPQLVEFAYLDPSHISAGRRRYDSWMEGDATQLAYEPLVVLIVENRDTYLRFPQMVGGICVWGGGKAGVAVLADAPWVALAPRIVYWGDLDADGFEILNGYRARGLPCESILMDLATLERFGRYGTSLDRHQRPIVRERLEMAWLTDAERAAYELITNPGYQGHVRLEQEKIPYAEALRAIGEHDNDGL